MSDGPTREPGDGDLPTPKFFVDFLREDPALAEWVRQKVGGAGERRDEGGERCGETRTRQLSLDDFEEE